MRLDPNMFAVNAQQAEQLLKLLANKHRLLILCSLQNKELSVSELNGYIGLAQSALSQHLATLRKAGIVATRRDKQTIFYRVVNQQALAVISQLHSLFCKES